MPKKKAPPKQSLQRHTQWKTRWWVPALIPVGLALLVYANILGNGFVTDDRVQLLKNPVIADLHQLPRMFGSSVWDFTGRKGSYYRPLQFAIYALIYSLAGYRAGAYHLFQVLLHAANTLLVFVLTRRLCGSAGVRRFDWGGVSWPALAGSALFAVHPIHSEAVDWVAALPDVALTFVALFAIGLFARQNGTPSRRRIPIHCALYLAALLLKETGAMLIPLYMAYEWTVLGRKIRELLRNVLLYAGLLATFAFYLFLRFHALGSFAPAQQSFYRLSAVELALNAVKVLAQYMGKLIVPLELSYYYPFDPIRSVTPGFLVSLAALIAIGVAAFKLRKHSPPACYGIVWIALTLVPVLDLTALSESVFGERYLYLPSVGLAWVFAAAWEPWNARFPKLIWAAALLLVGCSLETMSRNPDWRTNYQLLQTTVNRNPHIGSLRNDLAEALAELGERQRATAEARMAVQLRPEVSQFHQNLGFLLLHENPDEARRQFEVVLQQNPKLADAHYMLGQVWQTERDFRKAEAEYATALEMKPTLAPALLALSEVYRDQGKTREAAELCRRAAAARPLDPEPFIKLAVLSTDLGQYEDAAQAARHALDLGPESDRAAVAHYCLGMAYSRMNAMQAALAEFATASRLRPDFIQAQQAYQEAASRLQGK